MSGLPPAIAREARVRGTTHLVEGSLGNSCQGARFHSPKPLVVHSVELADGEPIWLCGLCRDNYRFMLAMEQDFDLPWDALRQFGNTTRALRRRVP